MPPGQRISTKQQIRKHFVDAAQSLQAYAFASYEMVGRLATLP